MRTKAERVFIAVIIAVPFAAIVIAGISLNLAFKFEQTAREVVADFADAVQKIEELQSENKELREQIDALREPIDGTYDAEFGYDYDYVVRVVGAEARGEPFAGMLAVAQCIADSAERMGITPEQVVKMTNRYAKPVSRSVDLETVNEACLMVFANGERPFNEPIEFFYSTRGGYHSAWHEENLVFCFEIGNHRFFMRAEVLA